jgi:hypothetical protein
MNNRKRKRRVVALALEYLASRTWGQQWMTADEWDAWENMPPVGREWGSPDFERLSRIDDLVLCASIERCQGTDLMVGHIPGIAGARSQGETEGELFDNLREVLEMLADQNNWNEKALDALACAAKAAADRASNAIDDTLAVVAASDQRIAALEAGKRVADVDNTSNQGVQTGGQ